VHFEARDDDSAERTLRDLVRRDPADAAAHHNLGVVGLRRGRSAEAAEALRQSVALRPRALGTRLALAQALRSAGDAAGAADAAREALALAPERREAAEFLSDLAACGLLATDEG
jgi:predicted Zn-dependent protease